MRIKYKDFEEPLRRMLERERRERKEVAELLGLTLKQVNNACYFLNIKSGVRRNRYGDARKVRYRSQPKLARYILEQERQRGD